MLPPLYFCLSCAGLRETSLIIPECLGHPSLAMLPQCHLELQVGLVPVGDTGPNPDLPHIRAQ